MVFCRNMALWEHIDNRTIYELMDAIHEVPNIIDRWGTYDNNIDKLRFYFGLFRHQKWHQDEMLFVPPDLVYIFDNQLKKHGDDQ